MPPAHQRIAVVGTLGQANGGGSEIFEFGMAAASGMSPQALGAALAPVLVSFWGHGDNQGIPQSVFCTGVRVEEVSAAGRVTSSYYTPLSAPQQGGASDQICTLLSSCVTLETGTPNQHGRTVRGRFYPPASMAVVGSTSTAEQAETYANVWAGLVNGFNDAGANVSVASTAGGGVIAPVTGVTVDTVIDTIRRRKNHVTGHRSPVVNIPG